MHTRIIVPTCVPASVRLPRRTMTFITCLLHDGIYYFPGIGSNSGYPREDHVLVTDPFEKHVTRTMDSLKKSLERAGCSMDSILHLEVFVCLPHSDTVPMPSGKARFEAYSAQ